MREGSRRFAWRYAVAGLGCGVVVGSLSGALVALVVVLFGMSAGAAGFGLLLVLAPFYGLLYGAAAGSVPGAVAGLACALVLPWVEGARARWWTVLVLGAAVGGLTVTLVATAYLGARGGIDVVGAGAGLPGTAEEIMRVAAVVALPSLLGGWLMARSTRSLQHS